MMAMGAAAWRRSGSTPPPPPPENPFLFPGAGPSLFHRLDLVTEIQPLPMPPNDWAQIDFV